MYFRIFFSVNQVDGRRKCRYFRKGGGVPSQNARFGTSVGSQGCPGWLASVPRKRASGLPFGAGTDLNTRAFGMCRNRRPGRRVALGPYPADAVRLAMVPSRRGNRSVSIHRDSWIEAVRSRHGGARLRPGPVARRQAKLVGASATFDIRRRSIEVGFRRRADVPFLLAADCAQMRPEIPWLCDGTLTVGFP